jgi:hypothetical protein
MNFAHIYLESSERGATVTLIGAGRDGDDLAFTILGDGSLTLYDRHGGVKATIFPYGENR